MSVNRLTNPRITMFFCMSPVHPSFRLPFHMNSLSLYICVSCEVLGKTCDQVLRIRKTAIAVFWYRAHPKFCTRIHKPLCSIGDTWLNHSLRRKIAVVRSDPHDLVHQNSVSLCMGFLSASHTLNRHTLPYWVEMQLLFLTFSFSSFSA